MGLAKSLRKANNLSDFNTGLQNVADTLDQRRKEEEQRDRYNTIISVYNNWQQGQQKAKETDYSLTGDVSNPLSPRIKTGIGTVNLHREIRSTKPRPGRVQMVRLFLPGMYLIHLSHRRTGRKSLRYRQGRLPRERNTPPQ